MQRAGRLLPHLKPLSSTATGVKGIEVVQFPCRSDNYGYLIHDKCTGSTAAVDTPSVEGVMENCRVRGWKLTHIFNTHHHDDHAGGNLELKELTGCTVVGPKADEERIPGIDVAVCDY